VAHAIIVGAERYHFSDACWIDNHTLHAQLRTNTTITDPEQAANRAAAAFALYRGPLLAGLEYDTDSHWLDPLFLVGCEERFGDGVIETRGPSAHRTHGAVFDAEVGEFVGGILLPPSSPGR